MIAGDEVSGSRDTGRAGDSEDWVLYSGEDMGAGGNEDSHGWSREGDKEYGVDE